MLLHNLGEEFLELLTACRVDFMSGNGCLWQVVPFSDVGVFAKVESGNFERWNSCEEGNVSNGELVTGRVFVALQEGVQELESFFNLLELLGIGGSLSEDLRIIIICWLIDN